MATKRRKVNLGRKEEGQEPNVADADLISKLPNHVIHHILSFVRTIDAVGMSLLSRRWRRMWCSIPALEFFFYEDIDIVDQCMKQRKMAMHQNTNNVITRFSLAMYYRGDSSQVDRWLSFAIQPHIQELDLRMETNYFRVGHYCLPQVALNLASLTTLNLEYVKLEACYPISFPSLKSLSLMKVDLEEEVLQNLMLGCPSIEKLKLSDCVRMINLRVWSLSLKFLVIFGYWSAIQVDAINLQSFVHEGHRACCCHFDLTSCKKIKNLSLESASFYDAEDFESQISGLLESLTLRRCDHISIRNHYLKVLILEKFDDRDGDLGDKFEFSIDAPNLVSLNYTSWDTSVKFVMKTQKICWDILLIFGSMGTQVVWIGT